MLNNCYFEPKKDLSFEAANLEAAPGYKFIAVKFVTLITCLIAWLAGEKWRQDAIKKGEDLYAVLASRISEEFTPSTDLNLRDLVEKVDLELCFDDYPISMLEKQGILREEIYDFWRAWEKENPSICKFRNSLGAVITYDSIADMHCSRMCFTYHREDDHYMDLASGRTLLFRTTESDVDDFNNPYLIYHCFSSDGSGYRGADSGKLLKMIVNAYATDLITSVMLFFITRARFSIASCYQDTIVLDVPDHVSLDTVKKLLSYEAFPMWAGGLNLKLDLSELSIIKEENPNDTIYSKHSPEQQEHPVS